LEEWKMPHIIVKLHPGRSEEQKQQTFYRKPGYKNPFE
jgi:hypothetical protein